MRAVVQRVKEASVRVAGETISAIGPGMLVLLAVEDRDTEEDSLWLAGKIARMRIFDDSEGVMNLDSGQVGGEILVVSQFTLFASTRKGNRPSYIRASKGDFARPMYERFMEHLSQAAGRKVAAGAFGEMMEVSLVNDGPVTIVIDTVWKE